MLRRWLKFHAVGAMGILVQLAALAMFKGVLGMHYLAATALAVETAVLHNFVWHHKWTWVERRQGWRTTARRFVWFHVTNGGLSILSNLLLMKWLAGSLHIHYLAANLIAIAITSLANFILSEWLVFRRQG